MLEVKQSIDLYLPRFRPLELSPAMKQLLHLSLFGLVAVVFFSILLFVIKLYLEEQLAQAKEQQVKLDSELSLVISQVPNIAIDKDLQNQISREEKLLDKQRMVVSFLRQDSISDSRSFTPLVEQLARQNVKGIWLSKFEVINQGKDIQLFGYAKTPEQVSRYLVSLGTQPAYQGRAFKQINVVREENSWSKFFLSTQQERTESAMLQETVSGAQL